MLMIPEKSSEALPVSFDRTVRTKGKIIHVA